MTGIEQVVLRIPEQWDPKWFDNFVREVLSFADSRNATGIGINVSGEPNAFGVYEVDSQNVDLAEGLDTRGLIAGMKQRIEELEIMQDVTGKQNIGLRQRIEELEKDVA